MHLVVYRMLLRGIFVAVLIAFIWIWNPEPVRAYRYHRPIDADEVQRIDVRRKAFNFSPVPEGDIPGIVAWFNAGRFVRDNDDLAGPGCTPVDVMIYLRSGERTSLTLRGDMMHVSQGKKHYFMKQEQLLQYIHQAQNPGPVC